MRDLKPITVKPNVELVEKAIEELKQRKKMKKQIIYKRNGMSLSSGNAWLTDTYDVLEETENGYKVVLISSNDPFNDVKKGEVLELTHRQIAWRYGMEVVEITE